MARHSSAFIALTKQVAQRRRVFLRHPTGRALIYPPVGTIWDPSKLEMAKCEAFIVFFVAELETYWEHVVDTALGVYEKRLKASSLIDCKAGESFLQALNTKRDKWARNNNANWSRIEEHFLFIGLDESKFPTNLWDSIEDVVARRGEIVHNSLGVRSVTDPRLTLEKIAFIVARLAVFDRDFELWRECSEAELVRLSSVFLSFLPGAGSIGRPVV